MSNQVLFYYCRYKFICFGERLLNWVWKNGKFDIVWIWCFLFCDMCRCDSTSTDEKKKNKNRNVLDNASNLLTNFLSGASIGSMPIAEGAVSDLFGKPLFFSLYDWFIQVLLIFILLILLFQFSITYTFKLVVSLSSSAMRHSGSYRFIVLYIFIYFQGKLHRKVA